MKKQQGQVALVILTVMAIALTLGVSVSRQVVTDVSVSEREEKSYQAFSGAEAGIEEALRQLEENSGEAPEDFSLSTEDVGADVTVDFVASGGTDEYIYPRTLIRPGESVVVWLRNHDADGTLDESSGYGGDTVDLCWGGGGAMEVTYFYNDGGNYEIKRYGYDFNSDRRNLTGGQDGGNNFSDFTDTPCADLDHGVDDLDLGVTGGYVPLFLVFRPLYEGGRIGVVGTEDFPAQGQEIYSTGQIARDDDSTISRRIRAFRGWDAPAEAILGALFSGSSISGN